MACNCEGCHTVYAYSQQCVSIFFEMDSVGVCGDYFMFPFVLKSCADLGGVWVGKCVHGKGLRSGLGFDFYFGTSLIDFYVKCAELGDARKMFDEIPVREVVSWNALIAGNGFAKRAIELFDEMMSDLSNVRPNWVTVMSVLPACAQSSDLERGRKIHDYANSIGLGSNMSVQTALAAMYAKCGSLSDAENLFPKNPS
ncbi:putative tetratricopeptide-like helical domain superfamily [Helianthus anomalus]